MKQNLSTLFSAILQLQQQHYTYLKKGDDYHCEVTDVAITLVLKPNRTADNYMPYYALRNARYLTFKQQERLKKLPTFKDGFISDGDETEYIDTSFEPPDVYTERNELQKKLGKIAAHVHPIGIQVLNAMLNGEAVADTAKFLNCSDRTIKKVRALIRKKAQKMLERAV